MPGTLQEQLAKLGVDIRALNTKVKSENRGYSTEEAEQFDRMEADYTSLQSSIERSNRADKIVGDLSKVPYDQVIAEYGAKPKDSASTRHDVVFGKYLRSGMDLMDVEEKAFMANLQNPLATMSTTTGSQGGYLVPQGFSNQLETAMKWFGGIEGTVEEFTTDTGNPFPWPTSNDTAVTGEIVGQNTALASADVAFGQVSFNSYIFSSRIVKVPWALMQDSAFDLTGYITRQLGTRLGRIVNTKMTLGAGSGSNEPYGIVPAAVAAGLTVTAATGNTTSLTFDNFTDLEHAVDPAYRNLPTARYMFHDNVLKLLKKLKDASNRPLWQPANTASFGTGAQPTINDHGYVINNDMAVPAANASTVLYGDMSAYKVRKVKGDVALTRLVERYAEFLQIAFFSTFRRDGNLIDAGTHPVAVFNQSAT